MPWIEDTHICEGCGSEVTVYTDGRSAYAVCDSYLGYGAIAAGDTEEDSIWRDGQSLVVACPAYDADDSGRRCGTEVVWNGEGISARMDVSEWAYPILEEAP